MALLLFKCNNCAKLFWNPCINVQVMARKSSVYGHFIIWPGHFIIWPSKCDLDLHSTWTNVSNDTATFQGEQQCRNIFESMNKCRSYGPDKLIYDHVIIWPSSVTLSWPSTYLNKRYNCAKIFSNAWINVEVWPWQTQLWPFHHLTFKCDLQAGPSIYLNKCFKWHFCSSRKTTVPNYFDIHAKMYKLWPGQIQMYAQGMHTQHMHIHRTEVVTTMSWSPQAASLKHHNVRYQILEFLSSVP